MWLHGTAAYLSGSPAVEWSVVTVACGYGLLYTYVLGNLLSTEEAIYRAMFQVCRLHSVV